MTNGVVVASSSLKQELTRLKTEVFKIPGPFREQQLDAMLSAAQGRSLFFVAATGQGKSLVYQLPAILRRQNSAARHLPTIVVSPLKALIQDQVSQLQAKNVKCAALYGGIPFSTIAKVYSTLDLLFITPEQLSLASEHDFEYENPLIKLLLQHGNDARAEQQVARFVFDEAHCILHWGNSFRPKYLESVQAVARDFPQVPISLLSATAPPTIREDLSKLFKNRLMDMFVNQDLERENLDYEIRVKPNHASDLHELIFKALKDVSCAIIYCVTKDQVDSLAAVLEERGGLGNGAVQRYHAGMPAGKRAQSARVWQSGQSRVMVATNAFGMGINAPHVRLIIHTSMPLSLTDYIQQCGRAGRDGERARCILYYNVRGDVVQARKMVAEYDPQELDEMISLCMNKTSCVRKLIKAKVSGNYDDVDSKCSKDCHCRVE